MTTIAIDAVSIASDSRRTSGHELMSACNEKIRIAHGCIYAFTGPYGLFAAAVAWHAAGAKPADQPYDGVKNDWTLIVIGPDHTVKTWHGGCAYPEDIPVPMAWGSGGEYALSLMDAGFSAADAVAGAAKRDVYTGGPVQMVNIREALDVPRVPRFAAVE